MERAHQLIGVDGLQIPLLLMQRYGLKPGAQVVLEFGAEGIHVLPALADGSEIEGKALRYLFRNLGDAMTVSARQHEDAWRVAVYASGGTMPVGELVYGLAGEFLEAQSTTAESMRRRFREIEIVGEQ
jgi:hypothetical protein